MRLKCDCLEEPGHQLQHPAWHGLESSLTGSIVDLPTRPTQGRKLLKGTAQGEAPSTPEEYLAALPADRAEQLGRLRDLILDKLPDGYREQVDFGMLAYVIPLETYPDTYNKHPLMYAALASQKGHMSLYLMNVYGDEETLQWFTEGFAAAGKKLDMGKACVRFKKLDDLPLDLIGQVIARTPVSEYIASYEAAREQMASNRKARRKCRSS